jgi:hypothetical protein
MELTTLLSQISEALSAPVLDQTGLTGFFDYALEYLAEGLAGRPTGLDPNNNADTPPPTLCTRLQQTARFEIGKEGRSNAGRRHRRGGTSHAELTIRLKKCG